MNNIKQSKFPLSRNFSPKHSACAGCGMMVAVRLLLDAAGPDTIIINATGCMEVTTTQYPNTIFKVPYLHSLFENASSAASGVLAALKYQKKDKGVNIIAIGGDGATFDIGLGQISGMWERGENILYVCYDNEAYQNTGYQSSGATPYDANTSTAPAGKRSFGNDLPKKDMIKIALAHDLPFVATATVGYPPDLTAKIKKALSVKGPKYLQIYTPCVPGWGIEAKDTVRVAQLAVQSGFYPIIEYLNGELVERMKIDKKIPVDEFLKAQKRFKHLFASPAGKAEIAKIQKIVDENIERFGL